MSPARSGSAMPAAAFQARTFSVSFMVLASTLLCASSVRERLGLTVRGRALLLTQAGERIEARCLNLLERTLREAVRQGKFMLAVRARNAVIGRQQDMRAWYHGMRLTSARQPPYPASAARIAAPPMEVTVP
jgi:hypothetical protein